MAGIEKLRMNLGVTQALLGYLCGTNKIMVDLWERGVRRPCFGHQKILAELFGEVPDECVELIQTQMRERELARQNASENEKGG